MPFHEVMDPKTLEERSIEKISQILSQSARTRLQNHGYTLAFHMQPEPSRCTINPIPNGSMQRIRRHKVSAAGSVAGPE